MKEHLRTDKYLTLLQAQRIYTKSLKVQWLQSIYSGVIQQYGRSRQQHHNTSLQGNIYHGRSCNNLIFLWYNCTIKV
ncbi:MAG: hypothetical protein V7K27_35050 [Nostoc sp.]|uniref:hypothetical protein n=1 Tax=Nostoc sp. TaxID=1180 RepID=UPI002FF6B608